MPRGVVDTEELLEEVGEEIIEKEEKEEKVEIEELEEEEEQDELEEEIEEDSEEELALSEDDKELTMRDRVFRERRTAAEKHAEIEKRVYDAETRAMQAELRGVLGDVKSYDADIANIRSEMAKAQEEGKTDAISDLTQKLIDARVSKSDSERAKREIESKIKERESNAFNPAEQAFLKLNPWFLDRERYRGSKYDRLRSSTIQLDKSLQKEKTFDASTHDYFRELDLRLRKKHPEVFGKKAERPSRSTVGGVSHSPASGGGKGNSVGAELRRRMEALHMNPNDPKQVAAWRKAEQQMK